MGASRVSRREKRFSSILEIWLKQRIISRSPKVMLEQRRAEEKGFITLKEAAKISNYSPDYIGQLIRAGKIRGEQVYSNVAWVTTEEEVLAYMSNKTRTVDDSLHSAVFGMLSERVFSYVLYGVIAFFVIVLLVLQYIFYVSFDSSIGTELVSSSLTTELPL